jgi:hypothetical protein
LQRRELAARAQVRHLPSAVAAMKLGDTWPVDGKGVLGFQPVAKAL